MQLCEPDAAPGRGAPSPPSGGDAQMLTQLRVLRHVAQVTAGSLDLNAIIAITQAELERYLPLHRNLVWLLDSEPASAKPAAGYRLSLGDCGRRSTASRHGADLEPGMSLLPEETPLGPCISEGEARYAELTPPRPGGPPLTRLERLLAEGGVTSWFGVPLRAGERPVGVLQSVCYRPTGFTNEQIQLLYLVADLLGPAISNCQLFARLLRAYDDLRQAQEQLIRAEKLRALGEMAGGMAHEFNNSLCGVLGFIELTARHPDLPGECRGHLDLARTCVYDAALTVRRVQDFARQRRRDEPVQPIDLDGLVRQTLEIVRQRWERQDESRGGRIGVRVECVSGAMVTGCATELREVVTNLVFNAVDAMPEGGTLTVRTWCEGEAAFLSVSDTGMGIPQAVRQRLFEPFFTTKGERGNGLGLSVTFGIVRRHGGEIAVESEPGRGSTFTVRLSASGVRAEAATPSARPAPAGEGRGLRVLVVEDEESIRRFLQLALEGLGHTARLAATGKEALQALDEEAFDVMLTDLGLPDVSGEQVAREAHRRFPGLPVVLLTGRADRVETEACAQGIRAVLGKPVTIPTLASTLTAAAKVERGPRS